MRRSRIDTAAIWAVSAWPGLNFAAANLAEVVHGGAFSLLGVLTLTVLLALSGQAAYQFGPHRFQALVVPAWAFLICLVFGYAAIRGASASVFTSFGWALPPSGGWIVLVLLSIAVLIFVPAREKMRSAALVFSFVAAGAAVVSIGVAMFSLPSAAVVARNDAGPRGLETPRSTIDRPNVYYFILDAYAGRDELRRITGYDNAAFLLAMESRGFRDIGGAPSNYIKTSQTLGALFSLDYPQTDDPSTWQQTRVLYPDVFDAGQAPELIRRLGAQRYTFWHAASIWSGCPARHLKCLGDAAAVAPSYMTQTFLAPTPFGRPMMRLLSRYPDALGSVREHLSELTGGRGPIFVFAHHLAPHPPYFRGRDCEPLDIERNDWNGWSRDERAAYVGALQCVNRQVLALVDEILKMDPRALIVLQGDHGTAFGLDWGVPIDQWPPQAVAERTSFLNLVRSPPECGESLRAPMGQLNTMRFVIACIESKPPDYVPEQTFLSTYGSTPSAPVVRYEPKGP
jgi:hypothetical protein